MGKRKIVNDFQLKEKGKSQETGQKKKLFAMVITDPDKDLIKTLGKKHLRKNYIKKCSKYF